MVNKHDLVQKSNNIYFSNNENIIDRKNKNNLFNIKIRKCNTKKNNWAFLFLLISLSCVILLFYIYEAPFINIDHSSTSYCKQSRSLYESEILHQESYHNDLLKYKNPHKNIQQKVSDGTFHKNDLLKNDSNHTYVNDILGHVKNKADNINNTNDKLKNKKFEPPRDIYSNVEKKIKKENLEGHKNSLKNPHSKYDELSKNKKIEKIEKIENNLKEKINQSDDTFYFYDNFNMDKGSKNVTTSNKIDNHNNTNDNDNILLKEEKKTYYDYFPLKRFSSEEELEIYLKKNGLSQDHFDRYLQRHFISEEQNNKKYNVNNYDDANYDNDNYDIDDDLSKHNVYTYYNNNRSEENFYNYLNENGLTEEHFHQELLKRSVSENDLNNDLIVEQSLSLPKREVSIDSILEHTLYKGKDTYKYLLSNSKTGRNYSNTSSISAFSKSSRNVSNASSISAFSKSSRNVSNASSISAFSKISRNVSNASSLSSLNEDDEHDDFKTYLLKNNITEEHFHQELLKYNGGIKQDKKKNKKNKKNKNKKKKFYVNDDDYNNLSNNFEFEQYKNFLNTDNNIYEEALLNSLMKFVFDDENYLKGKFLRGYLLKEVILKSDSEEIQNALDFLRIDIVEAELMTLSQFIYEYEDRNEQIKTLLEIFVEDLDEQDKLDICKNMIQYMKCNDMDIEAIYESLLDREFKIPKRVKMILNLKAGMVFGAAVISLILFCCSIPTAGGVIVGLGYILFGWYISSCLKAQKKWTRQR
ncbi:Plasmodium exported protein, unknown function [Plasmodium gaboni]|uniref:Uncharacterized protein n=1 Tax=Plasmodium gaboni TaxID=647221 RepID=A0ABY1ULF5_9APIC|nr:Plasmodium exported protein, unknown function [Plasmodium gaboni]